MKMYQKIFYPMLGLLFLSIVSNGYARHSIKYPQSYYSDYELHHDYDSTAVDALKITAGVAILAATSYVTGRALSWCLHKSVLYQYEPEFDLLARAYYNDAVIEEELVPYILELHDRNNSFYFFIENPYRNYPLLAYKNNLDWYINRLWLSKIFYRGTEKIGEITHLIEKLQRIKRYIVTDYRFVQEQRLFDKENRKRN